MGSTQTQLLVICRG